MNAPATTAELTRVDRETGEIAGRAAVITDDTEEQA